MRYKVITFGCQMNKSDSERISASLEKKGYKACQSLKEADLVVVNMCSVRQSAVDRVLGLADKLKGLKAEKILTGCMVKKDRKKFAKTFDAFWDKPEKMAVPSQFIPISNGCDNFCTYCIVPYTRGRLACRKPEEIIKEAENSVKSGIKEIWLLGQNVNRYSSGRINFAKLIKIIDALPGDFKIRFTSPHPADFSQELIETMAECKKISPYLNLPVQSGDDKILKKMNRPYTSKEYISLVRKIRKAMPGINLSTDVIVGFPGETEKQFQNTVKLFKELKFNIAYISKYSPRQGTAAFSLKDDVPFKEKKRREKILMKIVQK